ncbi:hypothetical protein FB451DRAFT_1269545 [Mycena latifolia]|nr:hypothetical protein FB451DRAFT_1269545 [Mycena latifolia]
MSVPDPPASLTVYTGAVDKLKKDELFLLCQALGVEKDELAKKKKDTLISLVNTILDTYPSFEEDPQFAGLYEYRKKKEKKGKPKKTSAVKTAEDLAEQSKAVKPLTGATLKLLQQNVTTDPAPSFRPLNSGPATKQQGERKQDSSPLSTPKSTPVSSSAAVSEKPDAPGEESQDEDSNSEEDSDSDEDPGDVKEEEGGDKEGDKEKVASETEEDEDDDGKSDSPSPKKAPNKPFKDLGVPKTTQTPASVLVRFRHPTDARVPAQEVFVENVKVTKSELDEGKVKHEATLTHLLPMALKNHSPMKADRAGRLLRPGVYDAKERMAIGSVAQHTDGGPLPPNLKWARGNTLTLEDFGDDVFSAELFYEPAATQSVPGLQTSLTGAKTDIPIEIAQQRSQAKTLPTKHSIQDSAHFRNFILEYTQFTRLSPTTNMTAGNALDSFLRFFPLLEKRKGWSKGNAGWAIPEDFEAPAWVTSEGWEQYRNGTFTQKEVILASGLKPTSTRYTVTLFQKAKRLPGDISKWVKAPRPQATEGAEDQEELSPYEDMKFKEFVALVDQKTAEIRERKSDEGDERKKKKKKREDGEDRRSKGKGKAKAKEKHRELSSDELDEN